MMDIITKALKKHDVMWQHLDVTWDWLEIRKLTGIEFTRLRNIHHIEFFRTDAGILVHWKQWMTDDAWSSPVLLVPAENMAMLAQARPALLPHAFPQHELPKMRSFLDRLQMQQQTAGTRLDREADFRWLYNAIDQQEPSLQNKLTLEKVIQDLIRAGSHTAMRASSSSQQLFPADVLAQLFPGSDIPHLPVDSLLRIHGAAQASTVKATGVCGAGSLVIIRGRKKLPFHLGCIAAVLDGGRIGRNCCSGFDGWLFIFLVYWLCFRQSCGSMVAAWHKQGSKPSSR